MLDLRFAFSSLLLACLLVVAPAWGQELNHDAPDEAITEGVLHIKVTEQAKSSVQLTQDNGVAQLGIASVDQLGAQYGVERMERIFPTNPRYAERHAEWGLDRWYRVYLDTPEVGLSRDAVSAFHADANIEMAEHALEKELVATPVETTERTLDLIDQLTAQDDGEIPNDPLFDQQWHFHNTGQTGGTPGADISLPMAHTVETGSQDVVVQVVDSGIEIDHPDIQNNLWINPCEEDDGEDTCGNGYVDDIYGYNFADNVSSPEIVNPAEQGNSHGLHVSGTVAATNNNDEGVASVAGGDGTPGSGVRIMTGLTFGSVNGGFAEALVYGADNGAVISNHSWGYISPGTFEQPVLDAIDYFTEEAGGPDAPMDGGLVVAAAGNSNSDDEWYPAFYETAMAVAGTDHNDGKYSGSNFGDWVEISAPTGEAFDHPVWSTIHTSQGSYGGDIWVGTSMASPHVAGVAALIASNQPGFTSDQVRARLIATGDPNNAPEAIGPRVNAFAALTADDTPPDPITDLTVVSPTMASGAAVQLEWTATGEAESEGTATSYDLRYSTDGPIETEDDFVAATPIDNLPVPQEAGTTESFTAQGLPFDTEVHFSIKAFDVLGNGSDLSNSPSTVTGTAPELALTPDSFTETIETNEVRDVSMNVANTGPSESGLEYSFPGFAAQNLLRQPGVEANNTAPLGLMRDFQKGEDPHAGDGHPVLLGAGGPDDFGYSWIDSNEAGGPAFSWVDASEEGDEVTGVTGTWDGNASVDIPFSFPFYEDEYTEAQVSVNGWINFDGFDGGGFSNNEIPSTDAPSNFIAAFWDDLDMRTQGTVHTYHDQSNSRFIIQWTDVEKSFDGDGTSLTFQAQLYTNGLIRLQYLEMDATLSASTIGIEAPAGLDGLQVAFNTPYVEDELAIDIEAVPDFIADVNPASGSLAGGDSDDVSITLDAEGVAPDTYENELALTTNDPNAESTLIPFDITVDAGPAAIAVNPDEIDFGALIENDEATESLFVDNVGGDDLEVTSITSDNDDFTVDVETPFTVGFADPAREVPVTFSPTSVGDISGTLTIESNAENAETITVDVAGEGLPAPVIGVDPESIEATVDVGATEERTLTVDNTGGSDLDFEAIVITNGEDVDPEMVAAPFEGRTGTSTSADAFSSQRPAGESATPMPFQASDFVYQLDDGSSEDALGAGGGDILWLNAFEAIEGATTITSIASAFGASETTGLPEGDPVEFLLYDDPTNNGDPSDAVLLERVETTSENPHTDEFQVVDIVPTEVEGTFFIGVVYRDYVDQQFPAPLDESSDPQGASWVVSDAQGINEEDLGDNALGPDNLDDIGFPGNWLLRADGTSGVVAVSPTSGTVAPDEATDLTVTLDATTAEPGTYEGSIRLLSNDFANSPLNVPYEVFVDGGPAEIAVDPDELDFGSLLENDEATESFFVDNVGGDDLEVTSITSDSDDFTVDVETPFTVEFDDPAREVPVTFSPTSVGEISSTVTIESNAENAETITVDVAGEGLPAPIIGVDPESIEATVDLGETEERTLTVDNTGGSDLEFEAIVITDGEDVDPEMVAAPFEGRTGTSTSADALSSQRPAGESATPMPFEASDFVYQLDDGSSENALGAGGGDILWLNAFEAIEGATTITSIASAFGGSGADGLPEGDPVEFLLYDDPTNNGDPSDAELLQSVETTSENPHTDEFQVVDIEPTEVEGTFFVALVYRDYDDGQFPAPLDESGDPQGASWVVGDAQGVNEENLGDNELGPDNLDELGFSGNWLLRADGTSPVVAVTPTSGTVAPDDELDLTVTLDATTADPGTYEGSFRLLSNDFANSPLNVPYDVFVDPGPLPELSLSPDAFSETLEFNEVRDVSMNVANTGPAETELEYSFPGFAAQSVLSQPGVEPNNTSSIVSGTRGFQKGEADPLAGEGHPVLLGAGGPDEFGYTWIDSNEEGGPTFSWVDISEDGEALPIGDEEIETVDLPFEFPFYGDTFSEIDVGDNGAVTFTGELPEFITSEIPGDGTPSIAPFWFDLDPSEGGEIYAYADEENNRFIIQYDEVPPWTFGETEDAFTFQIILTENGAIRYQYLDMDGVTDPASIGIQNLDGSDGLQIAFNTEYVENELAIDIEAAPDFIVDVNPASGSLAGGDSDDVSITLDADGVEPDIYEDELTLTTNDPDAESTLIPFDITVDGGAAEIAVDSEALSFDDVVAGESATETLTIENTGSTPLAGSVSLEDEAEVFSLTEGAGDYALGPDETQEVEVTFAPEEDASFEGTVAISHNADNEPDPVEVSLTGDGLAPSIAVDPEALSFDDVVAGESATETVTIENTGSAPLEGSVSLDVDTDAFELSEGEGDYALGPDETQDVEVTFAPDEAASFEGTVSITHNAGNEPDPVDVPLTGESVASAIAVNPEAINFDNVAAGESVTETVTIENTGSAPLEGSISLDADTDAFDLTEGEGDYSLAPDETQEVDVTFEPEEAASFEGTLSISHNADNEPDPLSVAISGEATPAEPVITQELDDVELVAGAAATTWDLTEFVEPPATSPDPLTFSASSTFPALVDVDVENSTLSATPLAVGIASITVTAETEEGGAATLDFEADVNALRAAPTIAFDDPRATASYRLTGLPGQIDEDVAATLSGDPDTGWRVFRDPGTEEDDLEAYDGSDAFRFAPGRGFWMLSREDWAVDTTVDPVALDEDSTTTVPLQEGWNILSNPLDRSVAWDATLGLAANDGLTESLWQWDGGWSESGTFTSAREGTAFYLFNDAELDALTLAHPDAEAPSSEAPVVAATTEEAETLQFTATLESGEAGNENQVEDIELGTVTLGYAPETRATRMPPAHFLPAQFSVRSEEADEEAAFSRLLKEPASGMNADEDGHAFDLRLEPAAGEMASTEAHSDETSPEEQTAKLALSEALTSEQFPGDEALLIGADGTRYDLREMDAGETVPVTLADEPAELRVLIGSEAFIDDELEVPDEITFGPAYPNPSRGPVTVEVALPSDAEAEIVLYDMLGRRVATVHEGELQRGLNEVQWSGDNLASGMYFLRLQTEGQTFTEKVVRVR